MAYSADDLLTALRTVAAELGRPPTATEMNAHSDSPSVPTFVNHFGSWNNALLEAGLEPHHYPYRLSDDELVTALQRLGDELSRRPSGTDVRACDDMPAVATYKTRFGSWEEALAAAGFPTLGVDRYSDSELVASLRQFADRLGRRPRYADLKRAHDMPAASTYERRFGSWTAALVAADLMDESTTDLE